MLGEGFDLPENFEQWSDWTWFKVRPGRILVLAVLSEQPISYVGHYTRGRMVPCVGHECKLCRDQVGKQLRYCFAATELATQRVGLMEVGRAVACQIQDWIPRHGGFRGMVIEFGKYSHSKQSRMELQYVEKAIPVWFHQIEVPNVVDALYATWEKAGFALPKRPSGIDSRKRFRPPSAATGSG